MTTVVAQQTEYSYLFRERVLPNLPRIQELIVQGVPDYRIAEQLGIAYRTWKDWKQKYPEMKEIYSLANQKLVADVQNALYKKAMGFTVVEKTVEKGRDGEIVKEVEIEKTYPPDTTAAIFFLTNRDPDRWKHRNALTSLHLVQKNEYSIEVAEKRIAELMNEIRALESAEVVEAEAVDRAESEG